jgi:hydrophobe/amphiphile efflux-1 (HAE1) family protein
VSLSTPFIRRPIATSLLMLGILLVGAAAFPLLPVAPLPQVDFPTIQVTTQFAGASPETMASSVAQPLETQFAQIPGLSQMTSTSALGNTVISLQFDLNRNIDAAAGDVQAAINAAAGQLPKTLPTPPTYRKVNPADSPIVVIAVHSDTLPLTKVDDYAETIVAQQISQISGVAYVAIGGQQKPAVRIQIDPAKIASLGLSLEDVRSVILSATTDAPKGNLDGMTHNFAVYDNDQLMSAAPWNDVIVAYRDGAPVRVRDVGTAVDGPQNDELAAWEGTTPSIILVIFKQPGANVIDTVDHIEASLPQMTRAIPPVVKVDIASDRTTTIRASVADVEFTMLLTIALVVAVIFVFLRTVWATVIPGVTVPLALIGTLALMYLFGYSLDNLSLMGLTIAVGFVVDDAIVMLENIHRHIEEGKSPLDAAIVGAGEIGFTIVSISLSLVAVFIPLLLMGGILGRLFREFAIVVSMTILVSAIVSLTLTPMMCARFLIDEHKKRHGRIYRFVEACFDGMLSAYERSLDFVLRHQRFTLAVFVATVVATGYLFVIIPKGFFPQQDIGLITGFTEAAQDVSFAEMVRRQHVLADILIRDPDVANVVSFVGAAAGSQTLNNGRVFITLKPRDERSASADQLIARWRPQFAKVQGAALFLQAAQDITVGARAARTQYQYTLQDSDLDELNAWAPKMLAKMKTLPELADVATDQQASAGTVTLAIDRDQAARFGIQPQLIDDTLYDAFGQRQVTQYFTQLASYYVIEEVPPEMHGSPATLDKIYLKSPINGQQVPLSTFVKYTTRPIAFLSINHQGQFPSVTLSFNLAPGTALGQAVNAINAAQVELGKPPTILASFQGNAQAFQSSLASEPYLIAAALIAVYIILGVLYESYIHPLTILSTLPSAGLGALLMLMYAHLDLSVIALVGVILLIGIVKKNGIIMIDFALQAEREEGLAPVDSIRRACLLRFRPIMMTTMAALLGGLPLMLGTGTGSEIRQPLGYAMVGGLLLSQALTLFTTPVIYLYLDRLSARLYAAPHKRPEPRLAEGELAPGRGIIAVKSES